MENESAELPLPAYTPDIPIPCYTPIPYHPPRPIPYHPPRPIPVHASLPEPIQIPRDGNLGYWLIYPS
jgi:hypothetical protein